MKIVTIFLKNTAMRENSCSEQIVPESLLELLKPVGIFIVKDQEK